MGRFLALLLVSGGISSISFGPPANAGNLPGFHEKTAAFFHESAVHKGEKARGGEGLSIPLNYGDCAQQWFDHGIEVLALRRAENSFIEVDIHFPGTCLSPTFNVCWNGDFIETFPVQIYLGFNDDHDSEPCLAEGSETLRIDMSQMESFYQRGYQRKDPVIVNFDGAEQSLRYTW